MYQVDQSQVLSHCVDVDGTKHRLNEAYIGQDGCNRCMCQEKGEGCTKKLCPPDVDSRAAEAFKCVDNMGVLHEENETYTHVDGCNTCKCMGDKGGSCTKMFCFAKKDKSLSGCVDHDGIQRERNKEWQHKDGCNKCVCGVLGPICTVSHCTHDPYGEQETPKKMASPVVEKNQSAESCKDQEGNDVGSDGVWLTEDNCNICQCKGNESKPLCTKIGCRVRLERLVQSDPSLTGKEPGQHEDHNNGSASINGALILFSFMLYYFILLF